MVEGLRLGLRGRRGGQSGLGLCGGGGLRKKLDFFIDSTAQVVEGLADIGGIIVGFVGVLRTDVPCLSAHILQYSGTQ